MAEKANPIKLREISLEDVLALAAQKAYRQEASKVVVFLPPTILPPCKAFKSVKVQTSAYGRARLFARPSGGGWRVEVKFYDLNTTFNSALPLLRREEAEKLLLENQQ